MCIYIYIYRDGSEDLYEEFTRLAETRLAETRLAETRLAQDTLNYLE